MEKIRKRFYQEQDVEEWIRICKVCIARKEFIGKGKSPLQIYNVGVPFERIQMDVLDPLTTATSGNRDLLVVVDCFTKWIETFPLKNIRAKSIAETFLNQVIFRYRVPLEIHTHQSRNLEFFENCRFYSESRRRENVCSSSSVGWSSGKTPNHFKLFSKIYRCILERLGSLNSYVLIDVQVFKT